MFEAKPIPDQEEIAEHEGLLKTLPQIQLVSDSNVSLMIVFPFVFSSTFYFLLFISILFLILVLWTWKCGLLIWPTLFIVKIFFSILLCHLFFTVPPLDLCKWYN